MRLNGRFEHAAEGVRWEAQASRALSSFMLLLCVFAEGTAATVNQLHGHPSEARTVSSECHPPCYTG
jgi:hypothetical protein